MKIVIRAIQFYKCVGKQFDSDRSDQSSPVIFESKLKMSEIDFVTISKHFSL